MAAGDVSKLLVSKLRDDLNDQSRLIVPIDNTLYDKLAYYQLMIMTRFLTNRSEGAFPLVADTSEYDIPENYISVVKIEFNAEIMDTNSVPKVDINLSTRKFVLSGSEDFVTGTDTMTVEYYYKPLLSEEITSVKDPLLTEDYFYLLNKCVLSEYRYVNENFQELPMVLAQIQQLAADLRSTVRYRVLRINEQMRF
jgi:hypothetical protein